VEIATTKSGNTVGFVTKKRLTGTKRMQNCAVVHERLEKTTLNVLKGGGVELGKGERRQL